MKLKNTLGGFLLFGFVSAGILTAGAVAASTRSDDVSAPDESETELNDSIWLKAPTLVIEDNKVRVEGDGAENWNAIYANDEKLRISKGEASLENVEGNVLNLRATLSTGVIIIQKYKR